MAPPPLAELTARAQSLTSAGDLAGARRVLANVLDPADAENPRQADPELAMAAALNARILIALGDPHGARLWAGFAHAAEERLHGPHDERTVAAAATHAAVLQRVGHHGRAAQVYHQLVGDLGEIDGPDSPRALAAEADLSTAEHAGGHCTAARARLTDAWRRFSRRHGEAAPAGIKMLARLGAMERECGRDAESHEHLSRARELCARHLPPDHPLIRQVAALAGASATGRHVCGRVEQSVGPPSPGPPDAPGVTPVDAPGVHTTPFPGQSPQPGPGNGFPPDDLFQPQPDNQPLPDYRPTDPHGSVHQQPVYLSDMSRQSDIHRLSDLYRAPADPASRHAHADAPRPWPGQRDPEYGPGGPALLPGDASTGELAQPPNTELVRPARPEPAPPRGRLILLAAVLVITVAAVSAVVTLTLRKADDPVRPATVAPASVAPQASGGVPTTGSGPAEEKTSAPVADPGAPQKLRLQDNRDSVALSWTYPKGAEGPVLISGGRTGQQPRAFQQLSAGSTDYVVYGLNDTQNYCFTVAVAYSADRIAASAPICTSR